MNHLGRAWNLVMTSLMNRMKNRRNSRLVNHQSHEPVRTHHRLHHLGCLHHYYYRPRHPDHRGRAVQSLLKFLQLSNIAPSERSTQREVIGYS
jgi:hypothetical protein